LTSGEKHHQENDLGEIEINNIQAKSLKLRSQQWRTLSRFQDIGEKGHEIFDELPKHKRATWETIQYNISTIKQVIRYCVFFLICIACYIARSNCQ